MQNFVYKHSKSPNICFRSVHVGNQSLRRHVYGAPNIDVLETLIRSFKLFSKPKVSNLGNSVAQEYISYLQISVNYLVVAQILHGREYLIDEFACLHLRERSPVPDSALEVPLVAKLGDNVAVIIAGKHLDAVENVGMLEGFQDVYLGVEELYEGGALHRGQLDDLDGRHLI